MKTRIYATPAVKGLRDVSEQNDTAHGDICAEMNLLS